MGLFHFRKKHKTYEMEYKNTHGVKALLEKLGEQTVHGPLDVRRKSVIK